MISALSSFSALNTNTQIIASSSDASPVQQVQRITRKPVSDDIDNQSINQQNQSKVLPQDKVTLLGEDAVQSGKAYGMEASELRKQGLKNQLSSDSEITTTTSEDESEDENLEVLGEEANESKDSSEAKEKSSSGEELSEEEKERLKELKERDREVRTHEQAHLAVAGSLGQGGATFEYEEGPDGKNYAVGGEVSIDTSPGSTPDETISKMQQVKAAALAPAEPSSQDRAVAASATQQMSKAMQDKMSETSEGEEQGGENSNVESESSLASSEENKEPKTVEEIQEEAVEQAVNGDTNEEVVESGLIEMPSEINSSNDSRQNNRSYVPQAKLSIQQQAARVAYGISA